MLQSITLSIVIMMWSGLMHADDKIDSARKKPQIMLKDNGDCHDMAHLNADSLVECTRGALVQIVSKSMKASPSRGSSSGFHVTGGSGFFIDLREGYVVTNHHVLSSSKADLRLKLANGEEYRADIVGSSPEVDVAVLKITNPDFDRDGLVELAFAEEVRLGESVIALGAPFGLQETVTKGIVSGINRYDRHYVQTDAAINGGNSGGPLLNMSGEVVGINTMKLVGRAIDNAGFAIASNIAEIVTGRIIEHGYFRYSYLGIYLQEMHTDMRESFKIPQDVDGVLITRLVDDDPPEQLKIGDTIVAIDDTLVTTPAEVVAAVKFLAPGTKIRIRLYRDGKKMTVKIPTKEYRKMKIPTIPGATAGIWGITFEEHTSSADDKRQVKFLLIKHNRNVRTDLAPGDKIIAADNITISDLKWFKSYLKGREKVVLHVQRGEHKFYVVMNK